MPPIPKIDPRIVALLPHLHQRDIKTYAYVGGLRTTCVWLVIARDNNVGTIEAVNLSETRISFSIKPNRDLGSSLLVETPQKRDPQTLDEIIEAALTATSATYGNFATNGVALHNHGWKAFEWAQPNLIEIGPNYVDPHQEN